MTKAQAQVDGLKKDQFDKDSMISSLRESNVQLQDNNFQPLNDVKQLKVVLDTLKLIRWCRVDCRQNYHVIVVYRVGRMDRLKDRYELCCTKLLITKYKSQQLKISSLWIN